MGILPQALELAFIGVPVFPCTAHKKPAIGRNDGGKGFLDATADEEDVRRLFSKAPGARLIGVPTGATTGFDVLDVDYRHGGGDWEMQNAHRLPRTRVHTTQSGGRHYLFRHAPGVRNSASKKTLGAGIDIRGDGGYVIHPPSLGYIIQDDAPIAEWPDWLLELILRRDPEHERPDTVAGPADFSSKRLDGLVKAIVARVSQAPDGGKHYALRNAALSLGGIQQAANLSDAQIVGILTAALPSSVKDWNAAKETIRWGIDNGRKRPLVLEDRPRYSNGHAGEPGHAPEPLDAAPIPRRHPASRQPVRGPDRDTIRVISGLRHVAADQSLASMARAKVPFYQRDKTLVRTALAKAKTSDGASVEIAGIVPVTPPMLGRVMGSIAKWEKVLKTGEVVRIDPPREIVEQIAAMSGEWPFHPITGIISTQTMRPDGTLLIEPGYDEATGLVLLAAPPIPPIPDQPTKLSADRAIETIQSLLAEFPFADEPSRSVAISMILTTVLRGALVPAVPLHTATAPSPGTGKSYLGDIAAAISTGERCAVIAVAPNPEETEKRLVGAALAGQQIIAIDNVSEMLSGDFLNQVTERPLLQLRPLGGSDIIRIANSFTVFANGNNLSAPADLVRRTLVCRLDANLENPEERTFAANPVRAILDDRGRYVAACLIIARAYVVAGYPGQLNPLPSFERWSNLVRSVIVWLGMADPCSSMELARTEDPIRAARATLFRAWRDEIGLHPSGYTVAHLIEETEDRDEHGFLRKNFREACLAVAAERNGNTVSPKRLGKWLSANKNNKIGELKLVANFQDPSRLRWKLIQA